jgi:deoxyribodipyrimidine photolyase-like uncharacterized protein
MPHQLFLDHLDASAGTTFVLVEHDLHFHGWQRRRLGVLVEGDGEPVGGRWSSDEENRKKLPRGHPRSPVVARGYEGLDPACKAAHSRRARRWLEG